MDETYIKIIKKKMNPKSQAEPLASMHCGQRRKLVLKSRGKKKNVMTILAESQC